MRGIAWCIYVKNPFRVDRGADRVPPAATLVIFGASGDLTTRKLLPALWDLAKEGNLPRLAIVGASRSPLADDKFRDKIREGIQKYSRSKSFDEDTWKAFSQAIYYQPVSYDDTTTFHALRERVEKIEAERGLPGNRLFYLSTPPRVFGPIVHGLGEANLVPDREDPYARVVIEKPFGTDLASAVALNKDIKEVLSERQIYRIDHYLGKETVQNLLVFRFANGIFEPLWNSRYVDHVQITGAETLGVEGRGGYFDKSGILRDMVQNHLFQVLALAAMEPPVSFEAKAVRDEKTKVIQALRPIDPDNIEQRVVRGQYAAGSVLGKSVPGYRQEEGVDSSTPTETYVALELYIDNWRWAGVPFYLRSAKRMPKKVTEVAIHFKRAPHRLFGSDGLGMEGNVLAIRIQPDEGITLRLGSKVPGQRIEIAPVNMEFRYASSFGVEAPEAYERLLLDALSGDGTLFTRGDEVEASWSFITPIHEAWASRGIEPELYEAGSWGPAKADGLLARAGRSWRRP